MYIIQNERTAERRDRADTAPAAFRVHSPLERESEREREIESESVSERESERERECVCV